MAEYIYYDGEEMTVRQYLKILKKMFKKRDLLDRKIEKSNFSDTSLIWLEDPNNSRGNQCYKYGIDHGCVTLNEY